MVMHEGLDERLESKDIDVFKKAFEEEVLTTYNFLSKNFNGCAPHKFVEVIKTKYQERYDNLMKAGIPFFRN